MSPRLVVLPHGEAFGRLWPDLAGRLDLELELVDAPQDIAGRPAVTLLACGGVEGRALDHLLAARRAGVRRPLVVAAEPDHRLAVQLMGAGAAAYFALPGDLERLEAEITRMARRPAEAPAREDGSYDFSALIGEHPSLAAAIDRASRVIPGGRTTVLLLGETGTGKELMARAIHDNGPRGAEPFVAVNCSALPGTLLESELFGHEKGAFTGASTAKPGLFELADGGTAFLDEISAMPVELQAKLLRFLETRELRRVGGVRTSTVDVRILAAANEDLGELVAEGAFREDLYYRLAVVPLHLPPLRERGDDAILLARHFLTKMAETYELPAPELSPGALSALRRHRWPGNVRELRNAIERALLLAGGPEIGEADLALGETAAAPTATDEGPLPFPATLAEVEEAAARAAVEMAGGNKSEAARVLGITRSRLYRLLDRGT